MDQKFGHIKPDATGTNDGDFLAHMHMAAQNVDIVHDVRAVLSINDGIARDNASGNHYLVKFFKVIWGDIDAQGNGYTAAVQLRSVPVDQAPELFLAGYLFGHIELSANFGGTIKQRDLMAPLCRSDRC